MLALGANLGDFVGRNVTVCGYVEDSQSGGELILRTTDDETIKIQMKSDNEVTVEEMEGLVQVMGKCVSSTLVLGDLIIKFNDTDNADFKRAPYNEMVNFVQKAMSHIGDE